MTVTIQKIFSVVRFTEPSSSPLSTSESRLSVYWKSHNESYWPPCCRGYLGCIHPHTSQGRYFLLSDPRTRWWSGGLSPFVWHGVTETVKGLLVGLDSYSVEILLVEEPTDILSVVPLTQGEFLKYPLPFPVNVLQSFQVVQESQFQDGVVNGNDSSYFHPSISS